MGALLGGAQSARQTGVGAPILRFGGFALLTLRSSPPSPFGRKIRIAAAILGLSERIAIVAADTNDPADSLRRQNPLGKIPVLLLEDGTAFYDSRVILEYLDFLAGGGKLIPQSPGPRFAALTLQALGDGLIDASILQVYEKRFRDVDKHSPKWLDHQAGKAMRTLAALEAAPPAEGARDVGAVSVACALGYLDLRFDGRWRAENPRLVAWLDGFAADVPAFAATKVTP
jgi:glutathione S-transferase